MTENKGVPRITEITFSNLTEEEKQLREELISASKSIFRGGESYSHDDDLIRRQQDDLIKRTEAELERFRERSVKRIEENDVGDRPKAQVTFAKRKSTSIEPSKPLVITRRRLVQDTPTNNCHGSVVNDSKPGSEESVGFANSEKGIGKSIGNNSLPDTSLYFGTYSDSSGDEG